MLYEYLCIFKIVVRKAWVFDWFLIGFLSVTNDMYIFNLFLHLIKCCYLNPPTIIVSWLENSVMHVDKMYDTCFRRQFKGLGDIWLVLHDFDDSHAHTIRTRITGLNKSTKALKGLNENCDHDRLDNMILTKNKPRPLQDAPHQEQVTPLTTCASSKTCQILNKISLIKNKPQHLQDDPHQEQTIASTRCSSSRTSHSLVCRTCSIF